MTEASLKLGALELLADPFEAQVGSSFGAWSAVTSQTSSLFLDGAVVSGEASANREIVLQVKIEAATRAALVAACEQLLVEANKQTNTLVFAPTAGPAVVYDVFRVQSPERVDDESEAWLRRTYQLTFPALPFARSGKRSTPAALAPAVIVEDYEAASVGVWANTIAVDGSTGFSAPVGAGATIVANVGAQGAVSAVSGCTVANASVSVGGIARPAAQVTLTAAAVAEVVSSTSWPVAANVVVTAAVNLDYNAGGVVSRRYAVGIEWLDGADASLGVDWGAATTFNASGGTGFYPVWAASPRPVAAAKARIRVRFLNPAAAGEKYDLYGLMLATTPLATVTGTAAAKHDGALGLAAQMGASATTQQTYYGVGYGYQKLPAAVDVSVLPKLSLWARNNTWGVNLYPPTDADNYGTNQSVSVRLYDAAGRWSRWVFATNGQMNSATWLELMADLAAPTDVSAASAADLTAVTAYDLTVRDHNGTGGASWYFDTLNARPTPSASTSPRGTVFDLNPILGSARSPAQVGISGSVALTDWLVAAVKPNRGEPMLAVTTNKATAAAPAKYDGVYSIIGCISPATAQTTPTCTVTQKINGTAIATQTLTGTVQAGNHYVDFGPVALPLIDVPDENAGVSIEFTLAPSSTAWTEVLVIDVDASLAWVPNLATAMAQAWVDEPDTLAQLGRIFVGTLGDRSDARALPTPPVLSRPLQVQAPSTRLLVYSTAGAPNVSLSYYPRWLIEPTA